MADDVPDLLRSLWRDFEFEPNDEQREAILHIDGPLFLPAGPGSGKTRVLLWRTVNLITTHQVQPEEIFISTFTEKAALQLRNGLHALLSAVSVKTGKPYDALKIYAGTVHSLCRRLLLDRRVSIHRSRARVPVLLDELDQYMFLRRRRNWNSILGAAGFTSTTDVLPLFNERGTSRHKAIECLISFFNRLSEEMIDPSVIRNSTRDKNLRALLEACAAYRTLLSGNGVVSYTDLSLLQTATVKHLEENPSSRKVFRHVIVDEYQDTNHVQERIFFHLSSGHKNICVVGDDDQALYRFRGATVENFVQFPIRCEKYLRQRPRRIVLATNYRSREDIVGFYNRFIVDPCCDWRGKGKRTYRVMDKIIKAYRRDKLPAVVASTPAAPVDVAAEIAALIRRLWDEKKVEDLNQIAFLFPSLKSPHTERMRDALTNVNIEVYAPRARRFLEVPESMAVFGLLLQAFGSIAHHHTAFQNWLGGIEKEGADLMKADIHLTRFINQKRIEIKQAAKDYEGLEKVLEQHGWNAQTPYDPTSMMKVLAESKSHSARAKRIVSSRLFLRFAQERIRAGNPYTLGYVVTRASSLDWNILDFFYQLAGFHHFKQMFDLAENGKDEGPVCNLSLASQYISRFLDQYPFTISGESLHTNQFQLNLFNYLYVLFRRGESEYEDAEDPFPKGRVAFLTVHQAKGLEFPVVVLANARKDPRLQQVEQMVAPLLTRAGEPLDRMPIFDVMRLFYVALSRAKNLLVVAHFRGQGQRLHPAFASSLNGTFPRIPTLSISTIPESKVESGELPRSYSYTGDFLIYRRCPRQYMLFRRYGFAPARSLTMFFGSLVHQTIEDLHQRLIDFRS